MAVIYGATSGEWEAFKQLATPDLLPYLADPSIRMHASSTIRAGEKTPGHVLDSGLGIGMRAWPSHVASAANVADWRVDPRHGICLITRHFRAIDIDIDDPILANEVSAFIRDHLGLQGAMLPARTREDSASHMLLYRLHGVDEPLRKFVVQLEGDRNQVEFLFDKQQTVVAGRHPKGARYEWLGGLPTPDTVPVLELSDIRELIRALIAEFARDGFDREWNETRAPIRKSKSKTGLVNPDDDAVVAFLEDRGMLLGDAPDGAYFVQCPWEYPNERTKGHTPDTTKPDAAKYYPAGMNRDDPGFKCLHASCDGLDHRHFLEAVGYEAHTFPLLEATPKAAMTRPSLTTKGKSGRIEPTLNNVVNMLRWSDGIGVYLSYDTFLDEVLYRFGKDTWQPLTDDAYTALRLHLTSNGMCHSLPKHLIPDAVSYVARETTVDSAREWLDGQVWDGVTRLDTFHTKVLGLEDTPYHKAACLYMWTAMAGRLMEPGTKADMVPILVGPQGLRKSSLVEAMAPSPDQFTTISLADRDDNLSRQLRGKFAVEWDELRGLNSRDADGIKAWVTHAADEWIPKFKEFGTKRLRRFIIIGTHNEKRFLNDPTGARRWLPLVLAAVIDVDYVIEYREQLWAEARHRWERKRKTHESGIQWEAAERLSRQAQQSATVRDIWVDAVRTWLVEQGTDGWSSIQLLNRACGVATSQANRALQERIRRVMIFLGWEENEDGRWQFPLA